MRVFYDNTLDTYQDPLNPSKITAYAVYAENGTMDEPIGVCDAIWCDGHWDSNGWEYEQYFMPACWFAYLNGEATYIPLIPTHWKPIEGGPHE